MKNLTEKDPQFSICSKLKFSKNLTNAIEYVGHISFLITEIHHSYMKHILLSTYPALKILGVLVSALSIHICFQPHEKPLEMFMRQALSTLKSSLGSVLPLGNICKRKSFRSIFKSICYEVSDMNFTYITYVFKQAINEVRPLYQNHQQNSVLTDELWTHFLWNSFTYKLSLVFGTIWPFNFRLISQNTLTLMSYFCNNRHSKVTTFELLQVPYFSSHKEKPMCALHKKEDPPHDSPKACCSEHDCCQAYMEKPLYQIPQKRICCALTVDSAGWKNFQREGSDNLKYFITVRKNLKNPSNFFFIFFKAWKTQKKHIIST